jgi:hypothetical protein
VEPSLVRDEQRSYETNHWLYPAAYTGSPWADFPLVRTGAANYTVRLALALALALALTLDLPLPLPLAPNPNPNQLYGAAEPRACGPGPGLALDSGPDLHRTCLHRTYLHRTYLHRTYLHRTYLHRTYLHRTYLHRTLGG